MKTKLLILCALMMLPVVLGVLPTHAETTKAVLYNYSRLALKDLDEMNKLVQEKIHESRKSGDRIASLREALQAVFARPNDDFMIDKVVNPLKNELDEHEAWESTVRSLVEEALQALKKPDKVKPAAQVTYAIMLDNFVADMKPRAEEGFEKKLLTEIRDAKIELTKKAKNERQMGMMRESASPSETAANILKEKTPKKK